MIREGEYIEESEDQLISEEYKIWKKHAPFLYDTVVTHVLEWPSQTVEWFGDSESSGDYSLHKLLLGTFTSGGDQNQLLLGKVKFASESSALQGKVYMDNTNDSGGVGLLARTENKIEINLSISQDEEVNRARLMPQQSNLVASKGSSSQVYIFDLSKHSAKSVVGPQSVLEGHSKSGFGLSWSFSSPGVLASGSDDHLVCVWNVSNPLPLRTLEVHADHVNDVSWSVGGDILASVGDDKKIVICDLRQEQPVAEIEGHSYEIHSVDFNKRQPELFATGSSDKTAAVWDLRNLAGKVVSLESHTDSVTGVRWAPFSESLLCSFSNDRRAMIWDLSRIGETQSAEEAQDGPPELLFIHGGHTARVSDLAWNPLEQFAIASVSEDNILQVWQMSSAVIAR